jgi:hypothetical protein
MSAQLEALGNSTCPGGIESPEIQQSREINMKHSASVVDKEVKSRMLRPYLVEIR